MTNKIMTRIRGTIGVNDSSLHLVPQITKLTCTNAVFRASNV